MALAIAKRDRSQKLARWASCGVVAGLLVGATAAWSEVRVGTPVIDGPQCPQGSVRFLVSPDAGELSILFSETSIELRGDSRSNEVFGKCSMTIPLEVGPGKRLRVTNWEYRGFYSVGAASQARLTVRNRYLAEREDWGRLPPHLKRIREQSSTNTWEQNSSDSFYFNNEVPVAAMPKDCGRDLLLRVDLDMRLFRGDKTDALLTLDSTDGGAATYKLATEDCRGGDDDAAESAELFSCSVKREGFNRVVAGRCDTGALIRDLELVQSNGKCLSAPQPGPGGGGQRARFFRAEGNFIVVTGSCSGTFKVVR